MRLRRQVFHSHMPEHILALTTCPQAKSAGLAKKLVEAKACACVNIIQEVRSFYWWKGKIEDEAESILLMKTEKKSEDRLWEAIKANHPYEVPEFVVVSVDGGSSDYLEWISSSVRDG